MDSESCMHVLLVQSFILVERLITYTILTATVDTTTVASTKSHAVKILSDGYMSSHGGLVANNESMVVKLRNSASTDNI